MMTYKEPDFEITCTGNTVRFSGKLEKFDYSEVEAFLKEASQSLPSEICIIDMSDVQFLNSRGLRTIVTFVLESHRKFEFRLNQEIGRQLGNIPSLGRVK